MNPAKQYRNSSSPAIAALDGLDPSTQTSETLPRERATSRSLNEWSSSNPS
jgi:hypothetical protein